MAKKNSRPAPTANGVGEPLRLRTLSATFEEARAVIALTEIQTCATFDQFARKLMELAKPKNRENLVMLYDALSRLEEAIVTLGNTTLVNPSDHPLVVRSQLPRN